MEGIYWQLPYECKKHAHVEAVFAKDKAGTIATTLICVVFPIVFGIAIITFWLKRNTIAIKSRSPFLIILGLLFLLLDCIFNTLSFTSSDEKENWCIQCRLSIFTTVIFSFGILTFYFLRMWRIYKVYQLYGKCLRIQRMEVIR